MDIERMRKEAEAPVKADAASLEGVSRDLSAAFVDEPLFNWFSRADARRDEARLAFFRLLMQELMLPFGEALRPASGGAAAVWIPSETLGPNPLMQELRALPVLLGLTGWSRFPRMLRLREVMDKAHPMGRPHAYLWFFGGYAGGARARHRLAPLESQARQARSGWDPRLSGDGHDAQCGALSPARLRRHLGVPPGGGRTPDVGHVARSFGWRRLAP
jgi:hypothetical protein